MSARKGDDVHSDRRTLIVDAAIDELTTLLLPYLISNRRQSSQPAFEVAPTPPPSGCAPSRGAADHRSLLEALGPARAAGRTAGRWVLDGVAVRRAGRRCDRPSGGHKIRPPTL
ncbi:hypothetical protein [Nocardia sp. NPDC057440]|uniref:hypothetical protein n=1 Tax=Nocardia sp. NPDC057440 TaxID=3346134 RepID=UPI00366C0691